ncbi:MAG: type I-E CRISPR-associated protein Cas6/Cse3/CasE [Betaproteobacteria bacterium]|nr:type I-E CRISPR-associated protein Cas6/Cse3/CasE [Betaproteobacteria bacterium]HMV21663.1 type I-E CRISPR-associated protein Cas6/Cse3/CasE [Rhodocyclaceae bacterium]HNE15097.1 type I-E CRISPR-associated protein Cas6/Cse3/CasE [Rhodocyclaceae bacterium]HNM81467.1 type I-E CRISPR-associated protein Cas6/Cse3/CasE [Rhodocyclaceae bacterium]
MYFSLITPCAGQERAAAHEWMQGAYGEHQWLWRFFPATKGSPRDFLFRRSDLGDMPRFYVLSKRAPERAGPAWNVQSREYAPRLKKGDQLQFELRANPVVTVARDGKSKRHDVVMQEKKRLLQARGLARWDEWQDEDRPEMYEIVHETCGKWLGERGRRLGFEADQKSLSIEAYQQHRGKKEALRFSTVDFSGTLTVVAPDTFASALFDGIGHAKAFGCGLLLVRRADGVPG